MTIVAMLGQAEWPSFLDWVPDGFDSWEAWVAIGTLALATATAYLGFQARREASAVREEVRAATDAAEATRDSAEATRRSAEVSERAFAAGIRPMLTQAVNKVPGIERSGTVVTAKVPLRNVGSGLALIQGMGWLHAPAAKSMIATTTAGAVPVGEETWLVFELTCADAGAALAIERQLHQEETGITILVRYVDATAGQSTRTDATLVYGQDTGWRWNQVAVFDGDAERAFAVLVGRSITVTLGQAVERDEALRIAPKGGATAAGDNPA